MFRFIIRRIIGFLSQLNPEWYGFSWCGRCKRVWAICEGHSTHYLEGRGCFPLCEECWGELTPDQRLPYYRDLWLRWREEIKKARLDPRYKKCRVVQWRWVKKAVLEGK